MSRIRHAGGNITVTTKGKETTYAKGNIELHSNKKVNIKGEEKGVSLGKPEDAPKIENKILKKFLVHFRRPKGYSGEFGFDWLREEYIYPIVTVTNDNSGLAINVPKPLCATTNALKLEYLKDVSNPINPYGVKYYPAWLSIFPATTNQQFAHGSSMHKDGVFLDLQFDELETMVGDKTEIILESSNPFLKITPNKFPISDVLSSGKKSRVINSKNINYYKLGKKVNVKCTDGALTKHEEITVFAKLDNKKVEVGKLMIYKNNIIPKAEIVVINVITSANKATLKDDYQYLFKNQSFNQALIRAEVDVDTQFDLTKLNSNADVKTFLAGCNTMGASAIRDSFETLYDKYGKYKVTGGIDGATNKKTYLFFTTLVAGNVRGICSLKSNSIWGNLYLVFNSALLHDHTIVHECGHSLSLPHVFQDGNLAKYTFYHGYTDNYMDYTWQKGLPAPGGRFYGTGNNKYNGKMHSFYKWQWDIMRGDRSLITNY